MEALNIKKQIKNPNPINWMKLESIDLKCLNSDNTAKTIYKENK